MQSLVDAHSRDETEARQSLSTTGTGAPLASEALGLTSTMVRLGCSGWARPLRRDGDERPD